MKRVVSGTMLVLLLTGMLTLAFSLQPVKAEPETRLYVDPPIATAAPGETFEVDINVANVEMLYAWYFLLSWNSSLLEIPDNPGTPLEVEGFTDGSTLDYVTSQGGEGFIIAPTRQTYC